VPPRLVLSGLICAGLAACASASPTSLPTTPPTPTPPAIDVASLDPCELLDLQLLSEAVDAQLPAGTRRPDAGGYGACSYDAPDASTTVTVLVARQPATGGQGEEIVGQLPLDGRAEELHGVGEVAWFDYCPPCTEDGASTLTVIEPPLEFTITLLVPAPDAARRVVLERLARAVIERLDL
jgi:hypothetical protein